MLHLAQGIIPNLSKYTACYGMLLDGKEDEYERVHSLQAQ